MRRWLIVIALAAGCDRDAAPSVSDRIYCAECKQIRVLQAKPSRSETDLAEIERLQKKLSSDASALATLRGYRGEARIELHPGCDCPCHLFPL